MREVTPGESIRQERLGRAEPEAGKGGEADRQAERAREAGYTLELCLCWLHDLREASCQHGSQGRHGVWGLCLLGVSRCCLGGGGIDRSKSCSGGAGMRALFPGMSWEAPALFPPEAATPGRPLSLQVTAERGQINSCWHREGFAAMGGVSLGTRREVRGLSGDPRKCLALSVVFLLP